MLAGTPIEKVREFLLQCGRAPRSAEMTSYQPPVLTMPVGLQCGRAPRSAEIRRNQESSRHAADSFNVAALRGARKFGMFSRSNRDATGFNVAALRGARKFRFRYLGSSKATASMWPRSEERGK